MGSLEAWQREDFDDANDALAADLGCGLREHRAKLVLSGNVSEVIASWSQQDASSVPNALWDLCDAESVSQAHQLFRDAGANAALANTEDCGPRMLKRFDVASSVQRVCNAALRSAFSCASPWVVGNVGISAEMRMDEYSAEAQDLSSALIKAGIHCLLVQGGKSAGQATAILDGVAKVNEQQDVPRPIILVMDAQGVLVHSNQYLKSIEALRTEWPELVGLGFSGVDIRHTAEYLPLIREVAALGFEPYIGFTSRQYTELGLTNAARSAVEAGAGLLRAEYGIPIAGTSILAEALGV